MISFLGLMVYMSYPERGQGEQDQGILHNNLHKISDKEGHSLHILGG